MAHTQQKESFKIVPPGRKKCVWMEAGVVSYKLCDNNFDCPTCTYDQAMQTKVAREREKSMERLLRRRTDRFRRRGNLAGAHAGSARRSAQMPLHHQRPRGQ